MIGQLKGRLLNKKPPELLLDVNGVAYEIQASMNTFYRLSEVGSELVLYTQLVVREDAHLLYGFHSLSERQLFRALIKVNGVGPKLALTLLSSIDPDGFVHCISTHDVASLVRLPGIGKKTAERLIVEMGDRLSDWCDDLSQKVDMTKQALNDAVSALIALGYKSQEASRAVAKVDNGELTSASIIRLALQELSA